MTTVNDFWQKLGDYASVPFPPGWNQNEFVFFSPRDTKLQQVILDLINNTTHSIFANHYGFDDKDISNALLSKFMNPEIACIMNLDSTQAAGVHEKVLLNVWQNYVGNSVAIGQSVKHAISHLKVTIIDGLYILSGSTNLSLSGETKQDNELRITKDPLMAARYSSIILLNHTAMLAQKRDVVDEH